MSTNPQELQTTTLAVRGMTCGGCARTIERVLSGVKSVEADFELGMAIVNGSAASSELIAAIEAAGYGASVADENLQQKGNPNEHRRTGCC